MASRISWAPFALVTALTFAFIFKVHGGDDADPTPAIERGNAAFDAGDFPKAISEYEQAVSMGVRYPVLFVHLGNAHYRSGNEGAAALWWRRAQITDPLCAEAFQNDRFIESKTGLLRFKTDSLSKATGLLPLPTWLVIAVSGAWVFVIGFVALTVHLPRRAWRTIALVATWLGALIAILGFTFYFLKSYRDIPNLADLGVILEKTIARADATDDGATVIDLPAGSEIVLLGERGPWTYIGIPGDLRGWIRTGSAEKLWPYDAGYLR